MRFRNARAASPTSTDNESLAVDITDVRIFRPIGAVYRRDCYGLRRIARAGNASETSLAPPSQPFICSYTRLLHSRSR